MTDEIRITVDEWSVTATEKVSTGEFENYDAEVTVSGTFPGSDEYSGEARRDVKARLLAIHRDMQDVVGRATSNRVSESEDWSVQE